MNDLRRIGILCDVFDPVHTGHIGVSLFALQKCGLKEVWLVPADTANGKAAPIAAFRQRMAMCQIAAAPYKALSVIDADYGDKNGDLSALVRKLQRQDTFFTVLIDEDRLESIDRPKNTKAFFSSCDFICFIKPGRTEKCLAQAEKMRRRGAKITFIEYPDFQFSSVETKAKLAQFRDPPELSADVLKYIAQKGLYIDPGLDNVKHMMSEHRFEHTLGVRKTAVELAFLHGAPVIKTAVAALLHDCAKDMNIKKMRRICEEQHITADKETLSSGALMHGPVGAYIARETFHITDAGILSAIACHTTGKTDMSLMDLIIFTADASEPGRADYEGLKEIRQLARTSIRAAALKSLYCTRDHILKTGRIYSPSGQKTIEDLEAKCTQKELALIQKANKKK